MRPGRVAARFVVLAAWMAPAATALACPACKEALFDPAQARQIMSAAGGYALSIGLLLGVPFALVGGLALMIVRQARRKSASSRPQSELTP